MITTQEFKELISTSNWWRGIFKDQRNASVYVQRFKKGTLKESSMQTILKKRGIQKAWVYGKQTPDELTKSVLATYFNCKPEDLFPPKNQQKKMETKISNRLIRRFKPCYDPSEIIKDEKEELPVKEWVIKYGTDVPAKDIVWLLLRKEFMSDRDMRFFAVWCAREAMKLVKSPDVRSISACDTAERFANGEADGEELSAARADAYAADAYAAYAAADAAAAADAYAAATAAYDAAYADAAAAAAAAAYDAAYDAAAERQLTKLLTYL
jgi:hypothetical protein